MNWLAHTLLSVNNIEYQLGNVLADPLRGRAWPTASMALKTGMKMHKAIDKFTDNHPVLSSSKAKLGADGHLKGVVLDILFDHFLSLNWADYSAVDFNVFLQQFNQQAYVAAHHYPDRAKYIVQRMSASNLLNQYQTKAQLMKALEHIDHRLSDRTRAKETASQYMPVIENQYASLQSDFNEFFPELVLFFKHHEFGSLNNHHLV